MRHRSLSETGASADWVRARSCKTQSLLDINIICKSGKKYEFFLFHVFVKCRIYGQMLLPDIRSLCSLQLPFNLWSSDCLPILWYVLWILTITSQNPSYFIVRENPRNWALHGILFHEINVDDSFYYIAWYALLWYKICNMPVMNIG